MHSAVPSVGTALAISFVCAVNVSVGGFSIRVRYGDVYVERTGKSISKDINSYVTINVIQEREERYD